jgi:hypothetical protein
LKASLLMALYSVRSERSFCEQLGYNLLFRWLLGMDLVEPSFDPTVFTKNRQRLLRHRVAQEFFHVVVAHARRRNLMSDEHFSVDGTLIEASASLKSFRPARRRAAARPAGRPGQPAGGLPRPEALEHQAREHDRPRGRLMRKGNGKEARLVSMAHALMENRNGLLADLQTTEADGYAERDAALEMLDHAEERGFRPWTVAADKLYDVRDFAADLRVRGLTPYVAQNTSRRRSAVDGRTTRHPGYAASQTIRRRIE